MLKKIQFNLKNLFFIIISFSFLFLTDCKYFPASQSSFTIYPSVGSDTSAPDSEFFYLDLNASHYGRLGIDTPLYDINTTEEYGSSSVRDSVSICEVEHDSRSEIGEYASESKICILDVMEQDIVLNDLSIAYNIPEGMCTHVKMIAPWHYNYETGRGPSSVHECEVPTGAKTGDDEEAETETWYCAGKVPISTDHPDGHHPGAKGQTLNSDGVTCNNAAPTANSNIDLTKCVKEVEDLCKFNYTIADETISCCYGNYYSSDGSESEWAGSDGLSQCLGGPGRTSWDHLTKLGFPAWVVQNVPEEGVRGTFDIKSILNVTDTVSHSTMVANFLKSLDEKPKTLKKHNRGDSGLPAFLQRPTGSFLPNPQLFFTVQCLDASGEVLHELNLMIREWNTHEEFTEYYKSAGSKEGDPDENGEEGDDCEYEERGIFKNDVLPCNDSLDFDDIIDINKATNQYWTRFINSLKEDFGEQNILPIYPNAYYGNPSGGGGSGGSN